MSKTDKTEPKAEKKSTLTPAQKARQAFDRGRKRPASLVANVPKGMIARVISLSQPGGQIARLRDKLDSLGFERATAEFVAESGMYATNHGTNVEFWVGPEELEAIFAEESRAKALMQTAVVKGKTLSLDEARREARKSVLRDKAMGEVDAQLAADSSKPDFLR